MPPFRLVQLTQLVMLSEAKHPYCNKAAYLASHIPARDRDSSQRSE